MHNDGVAQKRGRVRILHADIAHSYTFSTTILLPLISSHTLHRCKVSEILQRDTVGNKAGGPYILYRCYPGIDILLPVP